MINISFENVYMLQIIEYIKDETDEPCVKADFHDTNVSKINSEFRLAIQKVVKILIFSLANQN